MILGTGTQSFSDRQVQSDPLLNEEHALLLDVDLYCSIAIYDVDKPSLKIIGAEREHERDTFSDGDVVYINQGRLDGLEVGQLFLILEIEENVPSYGPLAIKRGRLRLLALADNKASAVVEKACHSVKLNSYLVPFEPLETVMGTDLGFDIPPFEIGGAKGQVVCLESGFNQIGSGHWAVINIGAGADVRIGQQLILYRIIKEGAPVQIFGNAVVVDVQERTSTIKVLSCRDALRMGDLVMNHPLEKQ